MKSLSPTMKIVLMTPVAIEVRVILLIQMKETVIDITTFNNFLTTFGNT